MEGKKLIRNIRKYSPDKDDINWENTMTGGNSIEFGTEVTIFTLEKILKELGIPLNKNTKIVES